MIGKLISELQLWVETLKGTKEKMMIDLMMFCLHLFYKEKQEKKYLKTIIMVLWS